MKKILLGGVLAAFVFALSVVSASAATYTTFGDASITSGGNPVNMLEANSTTVDPGYGGASFTLPSGVVVNNLSTLSTDYKVLAGDCAGGAPRFSIKVDGGKNIFVYLGTAPNFTNCPSSWQSTGNLISDADLRVDTSQVGGTFYDTWAHAKVLVGTQVISKISIVLDAGWAVSGGQSFGFDNVTININ